MNLPTKSQLLAALATTDQLAPAPRTLGRALRLLHDPDAGLQAVADLIRSDAALAVDVLRCANSAYYARENRIADVGDAVQVIGSRETIRLVSLVATHQATSRDLGSYGIAADDFWAESLFNGLVLEALAQRVDLGGRGDAYTTGLLRFMGRLAIDQVLQDLGGGLFWDGASPLDDWERENVGLTQAEVGAQLLRRWEFPEPMVLAIEQQDFPTVGGPGAGQSLVEAAHFVARWLPAGTSPGAASAPEDALVAWPESHPFAQAHQLTTATVEAIRADAYRAFLGIRETLYR